MRPAGQRNQALLFLTLASTSVLLSGCVSRTIPGLPVQGVTLHGSVHGGRQPVSGALIEMFAEGINGAPAQQLLRSTVTTDANGSFTLTGQYTCLNSSDQVYLTSLAGDPGAGWNSSLVLMVALGDCGALTASEYISMNEVTTVGAVYALAPYMTPGSRLIGTAASDPAALVAANGLAGTYVDFASGLALGLSVPRQQKIDSLADSIAACANSTGGAGPCATLFTAATPVRGTAPADTLSALRNVVLNPANNAADIYNLAVGQAPFQPNLQAVPTDWTLP